MYMEGKLLVFDLGSDATEPVFTHTHFRNISAVAWSSNDVIAYGGLNLTRIFSWRRATSSDSPSPDHVSLQEDKYSCGLLSFSPDGAWLAACSGRDAYVYDVQMRACLRKISLLLTINLNDLSFSSDGTKIYTNADTYDISDLRELPSSPDAGAVFRQFAGQRRQYGFDPRDQRWVIGQDGRRACRLPPLGGPRMTSQDDKVAVWDETDQFLLLHL